MTFGSASFRRLGAAAITLAAFLAVGAQPVQAATNETYILQVVLNATLDAWPQAPYTAATLQQDLLSGYSGLSLDAPNVQFDQAILTVRRTAGGTTDPYAACVAIAPQLASNGTMSAVAGRYGITSAHAGYTPVVLPGGAGETAHSKGLFETLGVIGAALSVAQAGYWFVHWRRYTNRDAPSDTAGNSVDSVQ
jgi:hypothetical protein